MIENSQQTRNESRKQGHRPDPKCPPHKGVDIGDPPETTKELSEDPPVGGSSS